MENHFPIAPVANIAVHPENKDRPLCHLYQLIHYRDRFAVPPSFRETIANCAIPKAPQRKPSSTARKSVSQPTSILQPTSQADSCRVIAKAICAVQAPRRLRAAFFAYFFLLLKKSRSPHAVGTGVANASEATNDAVGPNVLEKRVMQRRPTADFSLLPPADIRTADRVPRGRMLPCFRPGSRYRLLWR